MILSWLIQQMFIYDVKSFLYCNRFIIQMQGVQEYSQASKRTLKLGSLRSFLKEIPIMKKRSETLDGKMNSIRGKSNTQDSTKQMEAGAPSGHKSSSSEEENAELFQKNIFEEKYQILQKIGQGCNASVYKCIYKATGKVYAVKKFKVEQEHILTLKRDFIAIKELNHPSICRYKALYFDQNQRGAYLVMEYLPLPSLNSYKVQSEEELRNITKELFSAISYLHNRNVCHRDIKPSNILYDKQEKRVKIIDFGVSKKTFSRGVRSDMLTIIGTHLYLAPQVFVGGGYNQKIDLWALGVTLYKLVEGKTPFQSEYHSDTINNIVRGEFQFTEEKWSKYSRNFRVLVSRLLKKENERISLAEASKHFWLLETQSPKAAKMVRSKSYSIEMNENFHHEFKNCMKNATAKEEGSKLEEKPLFRSIKVLDSNHYDMEESDDEESIVSPSADIKRISFGTCADFKFFGEEIECCNEE